MNYFHGRWVSGGLSALFFCVLPLAMSVSALTQETVPNTATRSSITLTRGDMFTIFFLMLGPIKILGPFVQMTRNGDAAFARKLAIRAFFVSCLTLLLTGLIGESSLDKYHISIPELAIAAGIILFLVALKAVLQQFDTNGKVAPKEYTPDLRLAFSPLAFPTIVTPYGVSAVIVCLSLTPDFLVRSQVFAELFALMVVNLVAMLFAKPILKYLAMPLALLGVVLGVIQVALGLHFIDLGLRAMWHRAAG